MRRIRSGGVFRVVAGAALALAADARAHEPPATGPTTRPKAGIVVPNPQAGQHDHAHDRADHDAAGHGADQHSDHADHDHAAPAAVPLDIPAMLGAAPIELLRDWDQRARVTHRVIIDAPQTQVVRFETIVQAHTGGPLEFRLPAWRPGRYDILDLASAVRNVTASNMAGVQLPVEKIAKSAWRVNAPDAGVKLTYEIYANELERRTRHADDTHVFLSGAAVFMEVGGRRAEPQRVIVSPPDGWAIATGLDAWAPQRHSYLAPNYDVLIDAPLEIGHFGLHEFRVDGRRHQLAIWGAQPPGADVERLTGDLARLAEIQHKFWGDAPYGRYVWLLHLSAGASGGTEHLNSTIMQGSPDALLPGKKYRGLLSLASHEFFHTWNIKRLRPLGLNPYDFERENYTDLLWVAEGTTDYYESLLLVRAGLLTPDQYLKDLAKQIDRWRERPGRGVQSLAQASFDAWISHFWSSPDADNATVSIYREGMLASLALDMTIRRGSGGRASLENALRDLYQRFPLSGPGFTTDDFVEAIRRTSAQDVSDFFRKHIFGVEPAPLEELLGAVGLELKRRDADRSPATASAPASRSAETDDDADDEAEKQTPWLGIELTDADGLARVRRVAADGPAYAAGVQADDLIVTLDGRRLRSGELADRLRGRCAGDEVQLRVLRRDFERLIRVPLAEPREPKHKVARVKRPTPEQKAAYEAWLGQSWPAATSAPASEDASRTE